FHCFLPSLFPSFLVSLLVSFLASSPPCFLPSLFPSFLDSLLVSFFSSFSPCFPLCFLPCFLPSLCGHCKKLAPEFDRAATRLKGSVRLAKVDCTTHSETCGRFGVSGYPTLKIFRYGRDSAPYDGPRTAEGIYQYMKKQTGPDSVLLRTKEDLQAFVNNYDASIVGVFSGADSSRLAEFLNAAGLLREQFRFAHSTDLQLAEDHGIHSECVLLFRPPRLSNTFEDSLVVFKDYLTIGSLRRFIRDHIYGLCPHMTLENRDRLRVRDLLTAYYDLDYHHNVRGSNYWRNRVMKVASKYGGRGLTYSVANKKDFLSELEDDFGLGTSDGGELPFVTIRTRLGHKYTMREEFTRDGQSLERFLDDYFAGRLKRYVKSEPVPERNTADVKLYYDPKIVIAKMNAVENDVPLGYDVQGFPTIYFAPVGKKDEPVRYEGGRELRDFLNFLKREASHSLVLSGSKDEL
uniref:Thioredoxin domain-containing protein n=1 Tax=Amphiprion ocellaris TaxID=80972 RepID=A0AAQ6ARP5_AMPOC